MPALASKVNLIAALDTDGNVFLSVLQCNVDTPVFLSFMSRLVTVLDS